MNRLLVSGLLLVSLAGCASMDIPQAHKGRMFDRTGFFAFYAGGHGFTGPVLPPGTYFTGSYDEIRLVDCSMITQREPLSALTKDGVQFGLDIYVRFSADCSDQGVELLLNRVLPNSEGVVTNRSLYEIYVRPAVGEAVRQVVSPYRANDINDKREEVLTAIRKRFMELMKSDEKRYVVIYEVNLSNLDFPDAMDAANVERAVQGVLKDKAIAERERVQAEIETMKMRRGLAEQEGEMVAVKIAKIGEILRKYPEYLQYDLQLRMPEIYRVAGAQGNLVITAPSPSVAVHPRGTGVTPASPEQPAAPAPGSGQGTTMIHPNPVQKHDMKPQPREP
jgi:regulator of protease activity HflC (stomatin/prohibitin superfamily)